MYQLPLSVESERLQEFHTSIGIALFSFIFFIGCFLAMTYVGFYLAHDEGALKKKYIPKIGHALILISPLAYVTGFYLFIVLFVVLFSFTSAFLFYYLLASVYLVYFKKEEHKDS